MSIVESIMKRLGYVRLDSVLASGTDFEAPVFAPSADALGGRHLDYAPKPPPVPPRERVARGTAPSVTAQKLELFPFETAEPGPVAEPATASDTATSAAATPARRANDDSAARQLPDDEEWEWALARARALSRDGDQ